MIYDEAILDSIFSMVDRKIISDMDVALQVISGYRGPMTRRRIVAAVIRSAGMEAECPAWRAFAPGSAPSIPDVVEAVCADRGVPVDAVLGRGSSSEIVRARSVCAWCARRGFGYTLSMIGDRLGGRNHTTILHAISKTDLLTDRQPALRSALLRLCDDLDDRTLGAFYGIPQAAEAG